MGAYFPYSLVLRAWLRPGSSTACEGALHSEADWEHLESVRYAC